MSHSRDGLPVIARRVAVIGGGIAGLAAAHRLVELAPARELVLEAGPRLGGVLSTVHRDGFQVEQSADNFITTIPWGLELCQRLGLADQLVQTNPACRRTFVVRAGRLYRLPDGFLMMAPTRLWPLAVTPILSPLGKLRAALEYFIPPRRDEATRAWPHSSAAGWDARPSTGWSSRWSARSMRPTWRSSASRPRFPASARWSSSTAA